MKSANSTQSVPNSKSEIVNSKLVKPCHTPTKLPIPPTSPDIRKNRVSSIQPTRQFGFYRISSTNRPLFVQTNPILSAFYPPSVWQAGGLETPYLAKDYGKQDHFKTGENEPKRTQSNPKQTQFFAHKRPPKPKRTQSNPILSAACPPQAGLSGGPADSKPGNSAFGGPAGPANGCKYRLSAHRMRDKLAHEFGIPQGERYACCSCFRTRQTR